MDHEDIKSRGDLVFRFMVLTHEKIIRPYLDQYKEILSPVQLTALGLVQAYGALTMSQLAARMRITRQQASQVVDRLYASGFVERIHDREDRRIVRIRLTGRAQRTTEDNVRQYAEKILQRAGRLGQADFDALFQAICSLNRLLPLLESCENPPQTL